MMNSAQILINDNSLEVTAKLAKLFGQVETFFVTSYSPSLGLEERFASYQNSNFDQIFETSEKFRKQVGPILPYWESIIAASWDTNDFTKFAEEAIKHTEEAGEARRIPISRSDMNLKELNDQTNRLAADSALALCSICRTVDGEAAYIPLMDFRVAPNSENLEKIAAIVKLVGIPGAILRSGKSYHFFGFNLLNRDQMLKFLGKCILLAPITDSRYIGHRIIEGSCDLRISSSKNKSFLPTVEKICNW